MNKNRTYTSKILWVLAGAQIIAGLAQGVSFSMGSLLAAEIGGTAWGGAGATITTLGGAIWALLLARTAIKSGRRPALTLGMTLAVFGAILAFTAAHTGVLAVLLVGFFLLGGATAVGLQTRFVASDVSNEENRGRNLSLIMWSTTIGAVIGPNLFGVTEAIGSALGFAQYAGAYFVVALLQLVAIALIQVGLRPDPMQKQVQKQEQEQAGTNKQHAPKLHAPTWLAIGMIAVAHASMVAIMAMTPVHMTGHGASLTIIGITISAHVAGMYALSPVFGVLADKWGRVPTVLLGFAMQALSALLLIVSPTSQIASVSALILLGLGWSAALVGSSALLVDVTPKEHRAFAQGRSDFVMSLVGAGGGALAGPVVSAAGMPALASIALVFLIAATTAVIIMNRRIRAVQG
ncbi:MFS transporter [Corynebacterium lubricantis]|uniref:MFS transporter n=1 Tax=Corynebacterium lubricantis TaxID=541095 RepID=UPI00035DFEDA|nr:MFS transporter [Corynebacterium lubricantis]